MLKQALIEGFNKSTWGKNEKDGGRVFKNDLISDLNFEGDSEKIVLTSSVISEDLYSQYFLIVVVIPLKRRVVRVDIAVSILWLPFISLLIL